ncbi:MAG: sigma-70 family RNA polymerase sigma factor [Fimbriimonas sp.]|nr:sigma-70 family RNA polymerase sigma factor [Fimbriimonas sp.]
MDLEEIIDRTYSGDVQAFSGLVMCYRDMAFGYALTLVGRDQMAEDVVQESFLAAYQNLDRLRDPRAFGVWLRGIVRHQAFRAIRTQLPTDSWDEIVDSDLEAPSSRYDTLRPAISSQVRDAIDALELEQREAILLFYECGLSQSEIATQMGVTVHAVNMRLHAARKRLRRRLTTMSDNTSHLPNSGRIQDVRGPILTVQFAPNSVPPILSSIRGMGEERLCVIRHHSAGRVIAAPRRAGSIWLPGQEVLDERLAFAGSLDTHVVSQIVSQSATAHSGQPVTTGVKTVDLFSPLSQSGVSGIFCEWGLGVLVLLPELVYRLENAAARQSLLVFAPPMRDERQWSEFVDEASVGTNDIQITYLPVDDPVDGGFIDSTSKLDARIVLGRYLAEQAIWPCVDPLASRSKRLEPNGGEELPRSICNLLREYMALQFSVNSSERHALSPDALERVQRARKALRYLSQPFYVAEPYTKRPGVFVKPDEARRVFADILNGRLDSIHRDAFYMTGAQPKE